MVAPVDDAVVLTILLLPEIVTDVMVQLPLPTGSVTGAEERTVYEALLAIFTRAISIQPSAAAALIDLFSSVSKR